MIANYNGNIIEASDINLSIENRVFKFGDGIFETIKFQNGKLIFLEDHYFRLMASMRMLRMKIPMQFTLEFLEKEIKKITEHFSENILKVRLNVFRKDGGLYTPETNEIDYIIDVQEVTTSLKQKYTIGLYKDFYNYSGILSTIKTTNRMLNTIASVFAKENELDNCILLNERKGVVEVTNGNIFVIKDYIIKTPSLTEGCIKGITRKKLIELLNKNPEYTLEETSISPFEIQKADEVFVTNAIIGVQPVTNYRKKTFTTDISLKIKKNLKVMMITDQ